MRLIEVSYDKKEGLIALDFDYPENARPVLNSKIKGERVKLFLDKISSDKHIRERRFVDGYFEIIRYNDVCIKIYDYKHIREYCLLQDYMDKVDSYIRRKNNKRNISSKVTRTNKHADKKIMASSLVFLALLSVMLVLYSKGNGPVVPDVSSGITSEAVIDNSFDIDLSVNFSDNFSTDESYNMEDEFSQNYIYIDYEDRSDSEKTIKTRELYGDMIEKYAKMYGLEPDLVIALATQERGVHSSVMDKGGATGLMQIQNGIWLDYTLSAHNFETGQNDSILITKEAIADCETNIKIGCMILQDCMKRCDYNILLGLQAYNMGPNGAKKAVKRYAEEMGCSRDDIICNMNDCGWINYREGIRGDSLYIEHVLSYMGSDAEICIYKPDGTKVECVVQNYENVKRR